MVPQDAYIEYLTTPPPPPPRTEVLFEEPEILAEGTTSREKKLNFHFLIRHLDTEKLLFLTTVTQKSTMMSKLVDQYTKKTNFRIFSEKFFS